MTVANGHLLTWECRIAGAISPFEPLAQTPGRHPSSRRRVWPRCEPTRFSPPASPVREESCPSGHESRRLRCSKRDPITLGLMPARRRTHQDIGRSWSVLEAAGVPPCVIFVPHPSQATGRPGVVCEERATTWDAKRPAALRVAPRRPLGFVVRPPQATGGMLRPHASARCILGATKPPPFLRHYPSPRRTRTSGRRPSWHRRPRGPCRRRVRRGRRGG